MTLPAALPSIATGIRVSASLALLVCVTVEYVIGTAASAPTCTSRRGDPVDEVYAAVLLTAVIGYVVNVVLRSTERRALFWVGEERRAA